MSSKLFKKNYLKIFNILFLMTVFCYGSVSFANQMQTSYKSVNFITYYYLNPQGAQLISSLQYNLLQDNAQRPYTVNLLVHFYAAAINNSSNKAELLQKLSKMQQQYSEKDGRIINRVISEAENFISPPATSDTSFDLLWSEFFATGNEEPVRKIAGFLQLSNDKDWQKVIFLASAQWSLASNAMQHKKVKEILQRLYPTSTGIMKPRLQRIVDDPQEVVNRLYFASKQPENHRLSWEEYKKIVW